MLVDELREAKHELAHLRNDIKTLCSWQTGVDQKLAKLQADVRNGMAAREGSESGATAMALGKVTPRVQQMLIPILPFLQDYEFSCTPFVLHDIRFG